MYVINNIDKLMEEKKFDELYKTIKGVTNRVDLDFEKICAAIIFLIQNNYLTEASDLDNNMYFPNNKKIFGRIIKNMIKDQKKLNSMSDEEVSVYYDSIEIGHEYYSEFDCVDAYYTYLWGYYVTEMPVFLYYIGKMMYKVGNFKEAEQYFLEYLKTCGEKTSKAYLYLTFIERRRRNYAKATKYIELSNSINPIFQSEFYIEGFYNPNDSSVDSVKTKIQFIKRVEVDEDFFQDDIINCEEFYKIRDAYLVGNIKLGDKLFDELVKKQNKTQDERFSLFLLTRNKNLYLTKNRY